MENKVPNASGEIVKNAETALSLPLPLTLGHILDGMGAGQEPVALLEDIHVIRHTFNAGEPTALRGPEDLTDERVLAYTREQGTSPRHFPLMPPRYWVIFVTDGKNRSRLWGTFENYGELIELRTESRRFFDLRKSRFLGTLNDRLVIEWDNPRTWHRSAAATTARRMSVVQIADRDKVDFPGFDGVLLTYHQLCEMVDDPRYAAWQDALSKVQGVYLITDSSNGKQYVGKADGTENILGRWTTYARDGHGGNVALRELALISSPGESTIAKREHARNFVFSLLRVFGPSTPSFEVSAAESHYKAALMTRNFGLNRN